MKLTDSDIGDFQQILLEDYGITLSTEEASAEAGLLLSTAYVLLTSLPTTKQPRTHQGKGCL